RFRNPLLAGQPGPDHLPLVASAAAEVEQRRGAVLKFAKEPQRVAVGRPPGIDRLGLQPALPFLQHLRFQLVSSHSLRVPGPKRARPPKGTVSRAGLFGYAGSMRARWIYHPGGRATAVPVKSPRNRICPKGLNRF